MPPLVVKTKGLNEDFSMSITLVVLILAFFYVFGVDLLMVVTGIKL